MTFNPNSSGSIGYASYAMLGWSMTELADRAGVHRNTVARVGELEPGLFHRPRDLLRGVAVGLPVVLEPIERRTVGRGHSFV
jgi:hypothetical protein